MSRETNSLLLRYGLNTFWSKYLSIPNLGFLNLQFNSFFSLYLQNYFLVPLKIQYFTNLILLYVFYFNQEGYSFIYKFLKLKKIIITKLFYRKFYGLNLKGKKKLFHIFISFKTILLLTLKQYFIYVYFLLLKKKSYLLYFHNDLIFLLTSSKKNIEKKRDFQSIFFWKLRTINYILKFKWLGLFSSFLIYTYTKKRVKVIIKSLMDKSLIYTISPFTFKYFHNSNIKQKLYLIFLSLIFFKSNILNIYISLIIKKTKNKKHTKNLIIFFCFLKSILDKKFIPIQGLKFKISGRLGGKLRKALYGYKLGYMKLMTLNTYVDYSCNYVNTQYGSFSLKLWLSSTNDYDFLQNKIKWK